MNFPYVHVVSQGYKKKFNDGAHPAGLGATPAGLGDNSAGCGDFEQLDANLKVLGAI